MKDLEYDEFEVVLERSGDGYSARIVESPTGPAPAMPFVPPLETAELPALRLTMRGPSDAVLPDVVDEATKGKPAVDPKAFGKALFRALFNDKTTDIFHRSTFAAAKHGRGLRLRIRFTDVAELANLPWELLYDPDKHKYLCQYRSSPTVRLLDLPDPVPPIEIDGPLRMLVVISGPNDLPELDVEKEWMLLRQTLDPLVKAGRIELVRLSIPTLEALRLKVLAQDFHIVHFIGHGGIDASGEGYLSFIRPNGMQHKVPGSNLGVMLAGSPIRLAVLNSCHGGAVLAQDPYGSSAIALVEQGIPAVIAMQFQISDDAARTFSRTLYDSVAAGRPVDVGVTLGRQALLATSDSEWATPVLYLRGEDWVLFELKGGPVDTILDDPEDVRNGDDDGPAPTLVEPEPPIVEPEPVAPGAPTDLAGWVTDGLVELGWHQPESPEATVVEWGVFRNGKLIARVTLPQASDEPGAGTHSYFVVATAKGGVQSPPSAVWQAFIPALITPGPEPEPEPEPVPRRWLPVGLVMALVLVLAVTTWWFTRPRVEALPAPTHVIAAFDTGLVSVEWDPVPAGGPEVDRWEIYLDDVRVTTVREPEASFVPSRSGDIEYHVVAFGPDGSRSDPTVAAVSVPTDPKKTADVEISVSEVRATQGGAVTVTFETDNLGKAELVDEEVFVEAVGGGQLHAVSFKRGKSGHAQPCTVEGAEATCDIGGHAIKGLVHVSATVGWVASSTGLKATVKDTAGTTDPKQKNNAATYRRRLSSTVSPTVTPTLTPTMTSTDSPTATPTPSVIFSPPEITGVRPPNDG